MIKASIKPSPPTPFEPPVKKQRSASGLAKKARKRSSEIERWGKKFFRDDLYNERKNQDRMVTDEGFNRGLWSRGTGIRTIPS